LDFAFKLQYIYTLKIKSLKINVKVPTGTIKGELIKTWSPF